MSTAPVLNSLPKDGRALLPEDERRAAWISDRRTAITGTDIAAIVLPPELRPSWASPIKVYLAKKGVETEDLNPERLRWGKRLERTILEGYSEVVGHPIQFADPYSLHRVADFPLLGASLDARWMDGDLRPVDAKNIRFRTADWGEPGTDQFPLYYQTQLAVQMMATETETADLSPLFSGQQLLVYTLHRDRETDAILKDRAERWWRKHIEGDLPPEPDGSDACTEYLKARFARSSELVMEATPEARELVRMKQEADAAEKAAKTYKAEIDNKIKAMMGDAREIRGLVSWKNNRDSEKTDFETIAKILLSEIPPARRRELEETCFLTTPGARVLRILTKEMM